MLGLGDATTLAARWEGASVRAVLVEAEGDFLTKTGIEASPHAYPRSYDRYYYRTKALLTRDGTTLAVYVKDISRMGIGLISPVQLFPCDRVELIVSEQRRYTLDVVRCRRLAANCYCCGATFVLSTWKGDHVKNR
jgi:hypothetical protein